jgi:deoxyadenosine/deoxycytidine kinase
MNIFAIEGNIGAGKSYLIKNLIDKVPHVKYISEPLDEWIVNGTNYFWKGILERGRWSFCTEILDQLYYSTYKTDKNQYYLQERDSASTQIFGKLLGCESDDLAILRWTEDRLKRSDVMLLHLNTPPLQCQKHVAMRQDGRDTYISLDYLYLLDEEYKKWIQERKIQSMTYEQMFDYLSLCFI